MASWATNHTVTVTVDGIDRSAHVVAGSVYIRQNIGNEADVASFEIWDNVGNYRPGGWDEVTIAIDGSTLFGGFVVETAISAVDTVSGTRYAVELKDYSVLLDTVVVDKSYGTGYSDKDVVGDLFSTYLGGEGFDVTTNVTAQDTAVEIGFENVSLRRALNELAVRVGS